MWVLGLLAGMLMFICWLGCCLLGLNVTAGILVEVSMIHGGFDSCLGDLLMAIGIFCR